MKNKGFTTIEILVVVLALLVIGIGAYVLGTRSEDKAKVSLSPNPTYYVPTPTISPIYPTATPISTLPLSVSPTPTKAPGSVNSGIKGTATLKTCVSGSCKVEAVANMKIDIKNSSGSLVKTIYTDSQGKFSVNLDAGNYIVGPFQDPKTSTVVAATSVRVNNGYFSEVNAKFEATY